MTYEKIPYQFWKANHERNVTVYDNDLARGSSIEEAVVIRRFIYLWEKNKEEMEGKIFIQPEKFCVPVGLSTYAFRKIIAAWEREGVVKTRCMGLPMKKFYALQEDPFARYLSKLRALGLQAELHLDGSVKIASRIRQDKVGGSAKILNRRIIGEQNTPSPRGEVKGGGFFEEERPLSFEEKAASKLEQVVRQHRKLMAVPNRRGWAVHFHKLLQDVGGDKARIKSVLKWYASNIGQKGVPWAYSAKAFREKFSTLEAMSTKRREQSKPAIEVSAAAQKLAKEIESQGWQKGSAAQLPEVVEASLVAYVRWQKRVKWMLSERSAEHRLARFAAHTQYSLHHTPEGFVRLWFRKVHAQVAKWREWSGDLGSYVFAPEHKLFQKLGREEAAQFAGASSSLWEEYVNAVNEN